MKQHAHIYVHIPFCLRKCSYCSFFSVSVTESAARQYLSSLSSEIGDRLSCARPMTIHVGGGTPTALSGPRLTKLFKMLLSNVDARGLEEFAIEANPGTLDKGKIAILKDSGVSRVSLGAQSFDEKKLSLLGRIHDAQEIGDAIRSLKNGGFDNIGVDLIYGVPGETAELWEGDLRHALSLGLQHISVYCLSVEPGTVLAEKITNREIERTEEGLQRDFYYRAVDLLCEHGYEHYEISNFCLPGFESRHNSATWRYEPYLGLGPSAVSFDGKRRRRNAANMSSYFSDPGRVEYEETLDESQVIKEFIMLSLRMREGLSKAEFRKVTGMGFDETFGEKVSLLMEQGMIEETSNGRVTLSREALFVADEVIMEFF